MSSLLVLLQCLLSDVTVLKHKLFLSYPFPFIIHGTILRYVNWYSEKLVR